MLSCRLGATLTTPPLTLGLSHTVLPSAAHAPPAACRAAFKKHRVRMVDRVDNSAEMADHMQTSPDDQSQAVLAMGELPQLQPEVWGTIAQATPTAASPSGSGSGLCPARRATA